MLSAGIQPHRQTGRRNKKLLKASDWAATKQDYCESCRLIHNGAKCDGCDWRCPEKLPGNAEVDELWQFARTQWRVAFGGAYALDYSAVIRIAEALEIDVTPSLMEKIRVLELDQLRRWKEADHGEEGR